MGNQQVCGKESLQATPPGSPRQKLEVKVGGANLRPIYTAIKNVEVFTKPGALGKGLRARRAIKQGELIMAEVPMLIIPWGVVSAVRARDEAEEYVPMLEKEEPEKFAEILEQFGVDDIKKFVQEARASHEEELNRLVNSLCEEKRNEFWALFDCFANFYEPPTTEGICKTNALPCGRNGVGVFATMSRINHSCTPNCNHVWSERGLEERVYALCNINAGQELFTSYLSLSELLSPRDIRSQALYEKFRFECTCNACCKHGSQLEESDTRRAACLSTCQRLVEATCGHDGDYAEGVPLETTKQHVEEENYTHEEIDKWVNDFMMAMDAEELQQCVAKAAMCVEAHRLILRKSDSPNCRLRALEWLKEAHTLNVIGRGPDDHLSIRLQYLITRTADPSQEPDVTPF
eukprot:Platyproteum_vivax@DN8313_c0_g1_i1.p1